MTTQELGERFGVSSSTLSAKKRSIAKALRLTPLDPNYTLASLLDENPLTWMIEVDGFILDVRAASREIQEAAYAQGLIPYIPDEEGLAVDESMEAPTIIKFPGRPDESSEATTNNYRQDDEPGLFSDLKE